MADIRNAPKVVKDLLRSIDTFESLLSDLYEYQKREEGLILNYIHKFLEEVLTEDNANEIIDDLHLRFMEMLRVYNENPNVKEFRNYLSDALFDLTEKLKNTIEHGIIYRLTHDNLLRICNVIDDINRSKMRLKDVQKQYVIDSRHLEFIIKWRTSQLNQ